VSKMARNSMAQRTRWNHSIGGRHGMLACAPITPTKRSRLWSRASFMTQRRPGSFSFGRERNGLRKCHI